VIVNREAPTLTTEAARSTFQGEIFPVRVIQSVPLGRMAALQTLQSGFFLIRDAAKREQTFS
jgi:hypothetical protein